MGKGRYGIHGGQYIPETLMNEVSRIEREYEFYKNDVVFNKELGMLLKEYAGRPSLLYFAEKMTKDLGGAKIYFKREDLNHTGSHKINNVLGQALLAKKMGKKRIIAETGAGQHGVATATAAALFGLECEIYMGKEDTTRQALNVYRMQLLGAKVHPVESGTMTLKDAVNECMREWVSRVDDTLYVLGSVMGPHPFPMIVRDFQSVISREAREQILEKEGKLPDVVMACVGGGSNSMGMFYEFILNNVNSWDRKFEKVRNNALHFLTTSYNEAKIKVVERIEDITSKVDEAVNSYEALVSTEKEREEYVQFKENYNLLSSVNSSSCDVSAAMQ